MHNVHQDVMYDTSRDSIVFTSSYDGRHSDSVGSEYSDSIFVSSSSNVSDSEDVPTSVFSTLAAVVAEDVSPYFALKTSKRKYYIANKLTKYIFRRQVRERTVKYAYHTTAISCGRRCFCLFIRR